MLLRLSSALFLPTSGSEPAPLTVGKLLADLDLLIRAGHGKCLLIGVDRYELNALSSGLDHSIYDVVTGAADTNDLYSYNIFRAYFGFEIHFVSSSTVI